MIDPMNYSTMPSSAPEAINDPNRYQNDPMPSRPPAEQEAAILAHQARIDAARDQGLLSDPSDSIDPRHVFMWQPGYQDTPRGIQLGQGLGYRKGSAVSASLS